MGSARRREMTARQTVGGPRDNSLFGSNKSNILGHEPKDVKEIVPALKYSDSV